MQTSMIGSSSSQDLLLQRLMAMANSSDASGAGSADWTGSAASAGPADRRRVLRPPRAP